MAANDIPLSALTPISTTALSAEIVSGTVMAGATVVLACCDGTRMVLSSPGKGWQDGYDSQGVVGAVAGMSISTVVGTATGVGFLATSAVAAVGQFTIGVARTPSSLSRLQGAEWDAESETWSHPNMRLDIAKTFAIEDEDLLTRILAGNTLIKHYEERPRCQTVVDMTYYDRLGVTCTVSHDEIKKAYFGKVTESQPKQSCRDTCIKFQELGEAYSALIDEESRTLYDQEGIESVNGSTSTHDSAVMLSLLFGNEKFEAIVGELSVPDHYHMSSMENRMHYGDYIKQNKREVILAVNLCVKLDKYSSDKAEEFKEEALRQAQELSDSNLGCALLGVVGRVYIKRANGEESTFQRLANTIGSYGSTVTSSVEIRQNVSAAKQISLREVASWESASEEAMISKRSALEQILKTLWLITRLDIASAVDRACLKALRDTSVDVNVLQRRRQALRELGTAYLAHEVDADTVLQEVVSKCLGAEESKIQA